MVILGARPAAPCAACHHAARRLPRPGAAKASLEHALLRQVMLPAAGTVHCSLPQNATKTVPCMDKIAYLQYQPGSAHWAALLQPAACQQPPHKPAMAASRAVAVLRRANLGLTARTQWMPVSFQLQGRPEFRAVLVPCAGNRGGWLDWFVLPIPQVRGISMSHTALQEAAASAQSTVELPPNLILDDPSVLQPPQSAAVPPTHLATAGAYAAGGDSFGLRT